MATTCERRAALPRDDSFRRQRKTFPGALPTPSPSPPSSVAWTTQHTCNTCVAIRKWMEVGSPSRRVDPAKISTLEVVLSTCGFDLRGTPYPSRFFLPCFLHPPNEGRVRGLAAEGRGITQSTLSIRLHLCSLYSKLEF